MGVADGLEVKVGARVNVALGALVAVEVALGAGVSVKVGCGVSVRVGPVTGMIVGSGVQAASAIKVSKKNNRRNNAFAPIKGC
jgi:hypothetical protein